MVVAEGFFSRLSFGLMSFSLPLYAFSLGLSLSLIGVLLPTNVAVAMLMKPLMGAVVDRIGVRTSYIIACILRTCVLLALVFFATIPALFLARALHGVSIALRDPASGSVLSALGGKKAVAQRFAWYQTTKTVAGSVGQFCAGVLISATAEDYRTVFLIAAVLSALPLAAVVFGLRGPLVGALTLPQKPAAPALRADLRAALIPYAGLGFLITGTACLMSNLLPVLTVEYLGLPAAAAGSLYLMTAAISFTGPLWGWVADRVSLRLVLGIRAVGNVASSLIWLLWPSYPGLMAGKAADDTGKAAFRPAWGAVMAHVSSLDPPRRARSLAWMSASEDAGEMAGPIVAGLIWSAWGIPALLLIRASAGVITEVYAFIVARRVTLGASEEQVHLQ